METTRNRSSRGWLAGMICLLLLVALTLHRCRDEAIEPGNEKTATAKKTDRSPSRPAQPPRVARSNPGTLEAKWLDPQTQEESRVRKLLKFQSTPSLEEGAGRATATIEILVEEWGEIWNREKGAWEEMTAEQFKVWRQGAHDTHSAKATLVKAIEGGTGELKVERQDAAGDGTNGSEPAYNETESGIHLSMDWQGDALDVLWFTGGTEKIHDRIEIPFSKRFRSPVTDAEGAMPGGEIPAE